ASDSLIKSDLDAERLDRALRHAVERARKIEAVLRGTSEELADRRRAEADLLRAHEAALSTARVKSAALAIMSHAIRTPLTGILGMLGLALDTEELSGEMRQYLEAALTCGESLLAIVNDALDFSKMEAGKMDLEAIPFGLRDCLGASLKAV